MSGGSEDEEMAFEDAPEDRDKNARDCEVSSKRIRLLPYDYDKREYAHCYGGMII